MKTKKILYIFVLLFIPVFLFSCSGAGDKSGGGRLLSEISARKLLRVGTDFAGTPFAFYNKEVAAGFEIELMQHVSENLGVPVQWVKIPFGIDNFKKEFSSDTVDIIIESISFTSERDPEFEFSNPYFISGQAVVLRHDENVPDLFEMSMLKDKKIGVERGTTGALFARNNTQGQVVEFESSQACIDALLNREVYAIISDILNTQTTGWPLWKKLKVVLKNLTHEEYCIISRKGETALISRINEILKSLKDDPIEGVYAKLYRRWFY